MDQPVVPSAPSSATPDQSSPPEATPEPAVAEGAERTVDEVEAYWRERQGKQDKAHQAAEQVLHEQIESLQRQLAVTRSQGGPPAEGGQANTELDELRRQLVEEQNLRAAAERKAKFPALAEFLGMDDAVFATAGDVALAKLNSQFESPSNGGSLIAPTAPRRQPPTPAKPFSEKSKEELLNDLRQVTPAYEAWQREQQNR